MNKVKIRPYQSGDKSGVLQLWHDCGLIVPQNNPVKDIQRKMAVQPELFLVGVQTGRIVASLMAGYDGHRGWLNYLAVAPGIRRMGIGRQMVQEAEKQLAAFGCQKINLQVRTSNMEALAFYRTIGFTEDQVISLGKRLKGD